MKRTVICLLIFCVLFAACAPGATPAPAPAAPKAEPTKAPAAKTESTKAPAAADSTKAPEPQPAASSAATATPPIPQPITLTLHAVLLAPESQYDKDCQIPRELILMGTQTDVVTTLIKLRDAGIIDSSRGVTLAWSFGQDDSKPTDRPSGWRNGFITSQVPLITNGRVADAMSTTVAIIQGLTTTRQIVGPVFVEPNWRIGYPAKIGSLSWGAEGSPAGSVGAEANKDDFFRQWAMSDWKSGIRLFDPATSQRLVDSTGKGVLIGVFDAVPNNYQPTNNAFPNPVIFPDQNKMARTALPPKLPNTLDMSDHGFFVAGLVHGVAPDSEIHLYRVLDDYGDGDLGTLLKGLNTFLSKVEDRKLDLSGAVINLSLGIVEIPDGCKLSKEYSELWHVLGVADSSGIVIVAAAGNRSNRSLKPPVVTAPDIPAQWNDRVIAVAASNGKAQVACFSNEGVIYAPGGDGDSNCSPVKCQSGASDQCKSGVVSLVTLSKTGYGYWSGTSFATPLVSGLAALCMQKLYTDQHPLSAPTGVASTIRDKIQQSGTSRSTTNSTPMPPAIIDAKELLFNKCK